MVDKKLVAYVLRESQKVSQWAKKERNLARTTEDKQKYNKYYIQARMDIAGLYLLEGRHVNLVGYKQHLQVIRDSYNEYGELIKTNKILKEKLDYPEQIQVRIDRYMCLRQGLKMLYQKVKNNDED